MSAPETWQTRSMGRARFAMLSWALALASLWADPAVGAETRLRMQKVAEGVYAALQPPENSQNDSNSIVLVNDSDVMVIDAPSDPQAVAELIDAIGGLTDLPVTHLINTHWHSDHTQGNQVYRRRFGAAVRIVGHRSLAEDVPVRAGGYVREQAEELREMISRAESQLARGLSLGGEPLSDEQKERQRDGIEQARGRLARLDGAELLPPDVVYDDELVFERGGRTIRLLHFAAHTRGDTVVHLPREGVLLTGDLLDEMPYAGHGFPASWIRALSELESLEFETVVPGHGPVFEGKGQLRLLRDYFEAIGEQVRSAIAAERSLEQTQASIDLGEFRQKLAKSNPALERAFDAYAAEAVARTFAEASGAALE